MNVLLLRHAATRGNLEKRYVGRTDEPLCEEGRAMAVSCGADGAVRRVYVSPRRRAIQTARIWYPNADLVYVEDFAEMDFGVFEGLSYRELQSDAQYARWLESKCEDACPEGESKAEFSARVCAAFARVVAQARAAGETALTIVAHGGVLMAALDRFTAQEREYFAWGVGPCEGYRARIGCEEELRVLAPEKTRGGLSLGSATAAE